ncbi:MAG: aminotransferase class I/II-fold pyridoxal phosphate-dependent enzyme [Alphaproteobacteria bacterium]|nr:aminotransferase class I/II-fold pyridoxal phosphate-dependent enzyme [Alphaproteobacteria bacterium]
MSRIWLSPPHLDGRERALLLDAFDSNWIAPLGPHVDAFEAELGAWVEGRAVAALSSGTAALHLALILAGVQPGDRVVTSTFTFAATVNAIRYVGAEPVLVDAEPVGWTMDVDLLEEALAWCAATGRPARAVLPVDLYGQVCDHPAIEARAAAAGAVVIEDAAEALGSTRGGRLAGSFGAFAALSFNGNKIITTSGGGALVAADSELAARARFLGSQAREPAPHYEHEHVGYNYRLSNLLAAVGRGQLERLHAKIATRQEHHAHYTATLGTVEGLEVMQALPGTVPNAWLTCITLDPVRLGVDREAVRLHLAGLDIEARPVWKPMHQQPVFRDARAFLGGVSDAAFEVGLCLPSGSSLTEVDRARVVDAVLSTPGLRGA